MRPVGWLVFVASTAVPIIAYAQDAPSSAPTDSPARPVAFDLARITEVGVAIAPGAPVSRTCASDAVLPGDDPGIVVCARRERSYANISGDYDKGGWAEPPLPAADPMLPGAECSAQGLRGCPPKPKIKLIDMKF